MRIQRCGTHTQHLHLGGIGIGHESLLEHSRTACHIGQRGTDHPACAAFGGGDQDTAHARGLQDRRSAHSSTR